MEITITAPELTKAIQDLAQTLASIAPAQAMQITQTAPVQTPVQLPAQAPASVPVAANVPTTPQTYTMEQLAVAATQLVDAGRRTDLVALLGQFSVQALTALPKEQYGTFATQLRAMGARL